MIPKNNYTAYIFLASFKLYIEYVTDNKFLIYNAPKKLFDDFISFIE